MKRKNKKANVIGLLFILIFIFIIAMFALITMHIGKGFSEKFQELNVTAKDPIAGAVIDDVADMSPSIADELVFFIFLGLNIGVIASAVKTRFNPIVMGVFFILLILAVVIAAGLTNFFTEAVSLLDETMTLTGFIFNKYTPLIMCVLSGLIMIIMYGKQPTGSGGGF